MASHRPGYITASTVAPFLTGKGDELLKGGIEAAMKIADERLALDGLLKLEEPWGGNEATEWGHMHEPDAIDRYEELRFVTVYDRQVGIEKGWLSCTPDGYVGSDGLVEVKCPFTTKTHRAHLLDPAGFAAEHNDQCQFQLMLTGRKWVDLVSYDPRWVEGLDIVIVRITADPVWQGRCRIRLEQAEAVIAEVMEKLKSKVEMVGVGSVNYE